MQKYLIIIAIVITVILLNSREDLASIFALERSEKGQIIASVLSISEAENIKVSLPVSIESGPTRNEEVSDPVVQASAIYIEDLETGKILYTKNEKQVLPIASTTKLMTAQIILDHLNLDEIVTMSKTAINTYGGQAFSIGEKISARNLFYAALMASSNDASVALAEQVSGSWGNFVSLMNEKVGKLNLTNTRFANPTGLDDEENYSCAEELAVIAKEALNYPLIWEALRTQDTDVQSVDGLLTHNIKNSNKLLSRLPNITGGKTGYTDSALETFVFVAGPPRELENPKDNHQVLYVILGAPIGLRFQETEKLVRWVDKAYSW